jgi:hypothetical protein
MRSRHPAAFNRLRDNARLKVGRLYGKRFATRREARKLLDAGVSPTPAHASAVGFDLAGLVPKS